ELAFPVLGARVDVGLRHCDGLADHPAAGGRSNNHAGAWRALEDCVPLVRREGSFRRHRMLLSSSCGKFRLTAAEQQDRTNANIPAGIPTTPVGLPARGFARCAAPCILPGSFTTPPSRKCQVGRAASFSRRGSGGG